MPYNPPPNWPPPPPGWSPPPGWLPDPWWPAPPPGWPLWVPDAPRRRAGLIVGGIVAAFLVLAVAAVIVVIKVLPKPEPTEEDRIRTVVNGMEETYNQDDFDGFIAYLCHAIEQELSEQAWHFDDQWSLTVDSVVVTGDTAKVSVTNDFDGTQDPETENISFVREDGNWKACND